MTPILHTQDLQSQIGEKPILKGVELTINPGEVHVIMGPNGAGKSTLASVLMGHPAHEVTAGTVAFEGQNLLDMKTDERARAGVFLSFQYPQEVPGVTVEKFLRQAVREKTGKAPSFYGFREDLEQVGENLGLSSDYLERDLNRGFSGGEKKKAEMLQMAALKPKLAILDETDSGLDIDAVRSVYENIRTFASEDNGILIITHYGRILDWIDPDAVHIMVDGKIVKSGDKSLAQDIEDNGYDAYKGR